VVQRTAELVTANEGLKHEIGQRKLAEEERERLRDELLQAQKLEAIGLLAGGIAHDFNNLLTAVGGHLRLAAGMLPADAGPQKHLSFAEEGCTRAGKLVRQLLQFSRRAPFTPSPVDLNGTLANLKEMIVSVLGDRVTMELDLCPEPAWVRGDATSLEQVFTNIVVNARDAMPGGGVVRVSTAHTALVPAEVRGMNGARPGRFLRVCVEDSGTGMSREVLSRIFEPFFTTKKPGQGTGLGLAGAYGTVRQHGGWIDVWSKEGVGSRFAVYLPAEAAAPACAAADPVRCQTPVPGPAPSQRRTVLVVEDDASVRALVVQYLAHMGYTILQAGCLRDAVSIVEQQGDAIDLVFTDVTLPDGTGIGVADAVRRVRPGTPLLLTSGDASGTDMRDEISARALPFIRKPYNLAELAAHVGAALPPPAA